MAFERRSAPNGESLLRGVMPAGVPPFEVMFGRTARMQEVRRKIELVSATDVPVLLQGESGTGKELCAQMIHAASMRSRKSLVKVSCPAIPAALVESELFGYEKGAFTGANTAKAGRMEQAHLGTLLLDEVGSLDLFVQSKLLQVLQDGTFMRVGGESARNISTRVISIANRDLKTQVEEGSFRLDFLYRINAVTIDLPPLRERQEDIPVLVEYFSREYERSFKTGPRSFSKGLMQLMLGYHWPGNIRQLENLVRSYIVVGDEELLVTEMTAEAHTPTEIAARLDLSKPLSLKEITRKATQDLERQVIMKVLQANGWNRRKTAKWLKMSYRSLLYKLNEDQVLPRSRTRVPVVAMPAPGTEGGTASVHLGLDRQG